MTQGGNKHTRKVKLRGTHIEQGKDYEVKRDPDIRGAMKGRVETGETRDSRREDRR